MSDVAWMQAALQQAELARDSGEVPVGALLTLDDQLIAEAHNQPISRRDPSAHAEMLVLRQAGKRLDNYRLVDTTLYVTVEPCLMCVGAMIHARVKRLVYGASEPKAGAVTHGILSAPWFNHRIEVTAGVLAEDCGALMSDFFAARRR